MRKTIIIASAVSIVLVISVVLTTEHTLWSQESLDLKQSIPQSATDSVTPSVTKPGPWQEHESPQLCKHE